MYVCVDNNIKVYIARKISPKPTQGPHQSTIIKGPWASWSFVINLAIIGARNLLGVFRTPLKFL